jgi:antitoxin StbD
MINTNSILSDVSAGISELKKNPMSVVEQGDGSPVAILNRNKPVFYAVPASVYENMMSVIEDIELAAIVESRKNQPEVPSSIKQLLDEL